MEVTVSFLLNFSIFFDFNNFFKIIESGDKSTNIQYISCDKPPPPPPPTSNPDQPTIAPGDNYSYVQLTAVSIFGSNLIEKKKSLIHFLLSPRFTIIITLLLMNLLVLL